MIDSSKEAIKKARIKAGLTQTEAAEIVGATLRAWQFWEKGDREITPKLFEFFLLQTGQHPTLAIASHATIGLIFSENEKNALREP